MVSCSAPRELLASLTEEEKGGGATRIAVAVPQHREREGKKGKKMESGVSKKEPSIQARKARMGRKKGKGKGVNNG